MSTNPKNEDLPPIEQIYNKLDDLFGKGASDLFTMEFPCRVLDKNTYDYVGSDTINAGQIKPQTVAEAEFRLSDDMYDVSHLCGGPNGTKISETYSDILNQLVASGSSGDAKLSGLATDQDAICTWLTQEVDDCDVPQIDILSNLPDGFQQYAKHAKPQPGQLPRPPQVQANGDDKNKNPKKPLIDLYQKLLDAYESQRLEWENFKRDSRPDYASATAGEIDNYNRMLATFAGVVDKKLESLWTVLLVRGQYHRVRRLVGFLDFESSAEVLQTAKENLRASVLRSIDDTEDVYPVSFDPANWASYLSTAFKPQDLLTDVSALRTQLESKKKQKSELILQLNGLQSSLQDVNDLQKKADQARKAFSEAQTDLVTGYSSNAITAIKLYFDAKQGGTATGDTASATGLIDKLKSDPKAKKELDDALGKSNAPPITDEQFDKLLDGQKKCIQNQANLEDATDAYNRASLAVELAKSGNETGLIQQLQAQIQDLDQDIDSIVDCLAATGNGTGVEIDGIDGKPIDTAKVPTNISLPEQTAGASLWTEVVYDFTYTTNTDNKFQTASSVQSSWNVDLFFGSGGGSSSSSSGDTTHNTLAQGTNIKIGMRVMKVNINRPWFDASVFRQTQEFFHADNATISVIDPGTLKTALGTDLKAVPEIPVSNGSKTTATLSDVNRSLMPSWPKAFIVAKDVHIIFHNSTQSLSDHIEDVQKASQSGGGFLCFSCSNSSSSSSHSETTSVQSSNHDISIKIPAPQIIGWISELTPRDQSSTTYTPIDPKELLTSPDKEQKKSA